MTLTQIFLFFFLSSEFFRFLFHWVFTYCTSSRTFGTMSLYTHESLTMAHQLSTKMYNCNIFLYYECSCICVVINFDIHLRPWMWKTSWWKMKICASFVMQDMNLMEIRFFRKMVEKNRLQTTISVLMILLWRFSTKCSLFLLFFFYLRLW